MTYVIAEDLKMKDGDENKFNFRLMRASIGNAVSLTALKLAIPTDLQNFEFRATDTGDGFVDIWINKEQYSAKLTEVKKRLGKSNNREFLVFLPKLVTALVVISLLVSVVSALNIKFFAFLIPSLAFVSSGTAFGYILGICTVLSGLAIIAAFFNRNRS